ncbi:hypothetical protein GGR57DRAFT_511317 [Xylariaceae sp. FL1272]|nr:hypothetical protein GGR57DRAFT_511317 [Xylariaceae sp. FL1272]
MKGITTTFGAFVAAVALAALSMAAPVTLSSSLPEEQEDQNIAVDSEVTDTVSPGCNIFGCPDDFKHPFGKPDDFKHPFGKPDDFKNPFGTPDDFKNPFGDIKHPFAPPRYSKRDSDDSELANFVKTRLT